MHFSSFLFLILSITLGSYEVHASSDYRERLLLRPLPGSALLASFNFRSNATSTSFEQQHFRFFPRSLGQILQHSHTKELHLRFSFGRWDAESWGARPWNGAREGGTGVELWAWVEADTDEQAKARWLILTNALSGLFCASLNFIDSTRTIRPVMSFEPEGIHRNSSSRNLHLLHGTLPHEVVCTENLTPFLKLLPCKGKAGISSLLDGHKLFDATWQTMAVDFRPICTNGSSSCTLEIEQTVDMVLDIERSKRPRDNPIPRPKPIEEIACDTSKPYNSHDSCYPLDAQSEPSWSLNEVFGRPIKGTCPSTGTSVDDIETVCLSVPVERTVEVQTSGAYREDRHEQGLLRCYKLPDTQDFDLHLPEQTLTSSIPLSQPPLFAERTFTGYGQERGGVVAVLTNSSPDSTVKLVYLESLPWFMKLYLHTLRAKISAGAAVAAPPHNTTQDPIREIYYRPALDRKRGTHLELLLEILPASTLTLTYDFDKAILRYTEYPPDANRGFDVAPAVIRLLSPSSASSSQSSWSNARPLPTYLRTTSLLLPLPTPDFSMPYNVIILTSTVMALAFGSIFNLLVRRFVAADEVEGLEGGLLRRRVGAVIERVRGRFRGKVEGKME